MELVFELIGVSVLAIVADANKKLGTAVLAFMGGITLVWFLLHYQFFGDLINKGSGNG